MNRFFETIKLFLTIALAVVLLPVIWALLAIVFIVLFFITFLLVPVNMVSNFYKWAVAIKNKDRDGINAVIQSTKETIMMNWKVNVE